MISAARLPASPLVVDPAAETVCLAPTVPAAAAPAITEDSARSVSSTTNVTPVVPSPSAASSSIASRPPPSPRPPPPAAAPRCARPSPRWTLVSVGTLGYSLGSATRPVCSLRQPLDASLPAATTTASVVAPDTTSSPSNLATVERPRPSATDFAILPQRPTLRPVVLPTLLSGAGEPPSSKSAVSPASAVSPSPSNTPSSATAADAKPTSSPSTSPPSSNGKAPPVVAPSNVNPKSLRDRFNYASIDCAAAVRATNPESKGASAILNENKDSYLLSPCAPRDRSQPRHVVIELCDEILVDTLVLGNYELFSSTFRTVNAFVNSVYPPTAAKPWRPLATLAAANVRSQQVFQIARPVAWARYLRLEFVEHFGNQFFCPVSNVRVHGTTMLEEYKREEQLRSTEVDAAGGAAAKDSAAASVLPPNVLPKPSTNASSSAASTSKAHPALPPRLAGAGASVPVGLASSPFAHRSSLPGLEGGKSVATTFQPPAVHPTYVPFLPPPLHLAGLVDAATQSPATLSSTAASSSSTPPSSATTASAASSEPTATPTSAPGAAADGSLEPDDPASSSLPPPQEEGIYKVIMKRFSHVEANYKVLLQYMDEYAKGINEVIRANDENQADHFSRSMVQLSQHLTARLSQITGDLAAEIDSIQKLVKRHEDGTAHLLRALQLRIESVEDRTASLGRWSTLMLVLLVVAAIGPWLKYALEALLSVSLGPVQPAAAPSNRRVSTAANSPRSTTSRSPASRHGSPRASIVASVSGEDLSSSAPPMRRPPSAFVLRPRPKRRSTVSVVVEPGHRPGTAPPSLSSPLASPTPRSSRREFFDAAASSPSASRFHGAHLSLPSPSASFSLSRSRSRQPSVSTTSEWSSFSGSSSASGSNGSPASSRANSPVRARAADPPPRPAPTVRRPRKSLSDPTLASKHHQHQHQVHPHRPRVSVAPTAGPVESAQRQAAVVESLASPLPASPPIRVA
ncbi:hypothetical protein H9P43_001197 [Blastocladiella emersonii ATCC 22665]|nr:hypothetical protein H9P43_001197 [Blastocladiella emersonii ATCC 22665]